MTGCKENVSTLSPTLSQDENGNFILFVSNQSSEISLVDIRIYIDNELAVNQEFANKGGHNWIKYQFKLKDGNHTLYSTSTNGKARKDTTFTLPKTPYSIIDFWYHSASEGNKEIGEFSILFSDQPPGFM